MDKPDGSRASASPPPTSPPAKLCLRQAVATTGAGRDWWVTMFSGERPAERSLFRLRPKKLLTVVWMSSCNLRRQMMATKRTTHLNKRSDPTGGMVWIVSIKAPAAAAENWEVQIPPRLREGRKKRRKAMDRCHWGTLNTSVVDPVVGRSPATLSLAISPFPFFAFQSS